MVKLAVKLPLLRLLLTTYDCAHPHVACIIICSHWFLRLTSTSLSDRLRRQHMYFFSVAFTSHHKSLTPRTEELTDLKKSAPREVHSSMASHGSRTAG